MNEAVFRSILHRVRGTEKPSQAEGPDIESSRALGPETTTPETIAAAILAENKPEEVAQILAIWRGFGIKDLDGRRASQGSNPQERKPVREHLADLRSWQSKWRSRDGA